jgi:hypothetical protein
LNTSSVNTILRVFYFSKELNLQIFTIIPAFKSLTRKIQSQTWVVDLQNYYLIVSINHQEIDKAVTEFIPWNSLDMTSTRLDFEFTLEDKKVLGTWNLKLELAGTIKNSNFISSVLYMLVPSIFPLSLTSKRIEWGDNLHKISGIFGKLTHGYSSYWFCLIVSVIIDRAANHH